MPFLRLSALLLLLTATVFSGNRAARADTAVSGSITADTVWTLENSPYVVVSDITVRGLNNGDTAGLTIEPGVEVRFAAGTGLYVGATGYYTTYYGWLDARGTEAEPIVFTSDNDTPLPGDWKALYFRAQSVDDNTHLEHCIVEYGGASHSAGIYLASTDFRIMNSVVRHSSDAGIRINGAFVSRIGEENGGNEFAYNATYGVFLETSDALPSIHDNQFHHNGGPALRVASNNDVQRNAFWENGRDIIEVIGGAVTNGPTWTDQGVPYVVLANLTVQGQNNGDTAGLILEPGVELRFAAGMGLYIGNTGYYTAYYGWLRAAGTPERPVVFTFDGDDPAPGDWRGLYFRTQTVDAETLLDHFVIEYGGHTNNANLYLDDVSFPIRNGRISRSGGNGIFINGSFTDIIGGEETGNDIGENAGHGLIQANTTATPRVMENHFHDNGGPAMRLGPNLHVVRNTFANNGRDVIEVIGGSVVNGATWENMGVPYVILGNLTVQGANNGETAGLTLTPGVELRFAAGTGLYIGTTGYYTTFYGWLRAAGTGESPIVFTSDAALPAPGDWRGLYFRTQTVDSETVLDHGIIEYGGHTNGANLYLDDATFPVRNSIIRNGSQNGVTAVGAGTAVFGGVETGNEICENGAYGYYQTAASGTSILVENRIHNNGGTALRLGTNFTAFDNDIRDNGRDAIEIWGGSLTLDAHWTDQGAPYVVLSNLTVQGKSNEETAGLVLDPGVELRFVAGTGLYIGTTGYYTTFYGWLDAVGAANDPIRFTVDSDAPQPGDWRGLYFRSQTADDLTVLEHTVVEYGGHTNNANIHLASAAFPIRQSIIRNGSQYGIYADDSTTEAALEGNLFQNNGGMAVSVPANEADRMTGNAGDGRIEIRQSAFNREGGIWRRQPMDYEIGGNITVQGAANGASSVLTIEPGTFVRFRPGTRLTVGASGYYTSYYGALIAEGTPELPVTLTSANALPSAGDWDGVHFTDWNLDGRSSMEYCVVEYGGSEIGGNVFIENASISFQFNTLQNGSEAGLRISGENSHTPEIACSNFKDNRTGMRVEGTANPSVHDCNFLGNTEFALQNTHTAYQIQATDNWWGYDDDPGTDTGRGDVDGYVLYTPWLAGPSDCIAEPPLNLPPFSPMFPDPPHGATDLAPSEGELPLSWMGGDPNPGDTVEYDLYFGTAESGLVLKASALPTGESLATDLLAGVRYYWRVVARDSFGEETPGPVWEFVTQGPPPDLILSAVWPEPDTGLQSGQAVAIRARITNIGQGPLVDAVFVALSVDGVPLDARMLSTVLTSGESAEVAFDWIARAGSHTALAKADPDNILEEEFEDNNTLEAQLPFVPFADLLVQSVELTDENPVQGQHGTVRVVFRNAADATRHAFRVALEFRGQMLTTEIEGGLAAGQTDEALFEIIVPAGEVRVAAIVDDDDRVLESDEENNRLEAVVATVAYPDLVPQNILVSHSAPMHGETVTVSFEAFNSGDGATMKSFDVSLLDNGQPVASRRIVDGLASGGGWPVDLQWVTQTGTHDLAVFVDSAMELAESDEADNVQPAAAFNIPFPDFVVEETSFRPENPEQGESVYFTATIRNQGEGGSVVPAAVRFLMDGSPLENAALSTGLEAGAALQITNATAWRAQSGVHCFEILVNPEQTLPESNTENNAGGNCLPEILQPNLTITAVQMIPSAPVIGEAVVFRTTAKNTGNGATWIPFAVGLRLNGALVSGARTVQKLEAGESATVDLSWLAASGDWTPAVEIDIHDGVDESDESDNVFDLDSFHVAPAPTLTVGLDGHTPGEPVYGTQTVSWTATHPEGLAVSEVRLYLSRYGDEEIASGLPASGSMDWDTTAHPDARYRLRGVAIDERGAEGDFLTEAFDLVNERDIVAEALPGWRSAGTDEEMIFELRITNQQPVADSVTLFLGNPDGIGTLAADENTLALEAWGQTSTLIHCSSASAGTFRIEATAVSQTTPSLSGTVVFTAYVSEPFDIALSPGSVTASAGGDAAYNLAITNRMQVHETYSVLITGISETWHDTPDRALLVPGQTLNLPIELSDIDQTGDHTLHVSVTLDRLGLTKEKEAVLHVIADPVISGLKPLDGARIGSNRATVFWMTNVPGSTRVHLRPSAETEWESSDGQSGRYHGLEWTDLAWNTSYEFYVETETEYGRAESDVRTFHVENGVAFSSAAYVFSRPRNPDQRLPIGLRNLAAEPKQVIVTLPDPPPELGLGFENPLSDGRTGTSLLLDGNGEVELDILADTREVETTSFDFLVELETTGDGIVLRDAATVRLLIEESVIAFDFSETHSDPVTLAKTYTLTNTGDPVGDFRVETDDELREKTSLSPTLTHAYLGTGHSLSFTITPELTPDFTSLAGTILVHGGGETVSHPVAFELSDGDEIYEGSLDGAVCDFDPPDPADIVYTDIREGHTAFDWIRGDGGQAVSCVLDDMESSAVVPSQEEIDEGFRIFDVSVSDSMDNGLVRFEFSGTVEDGAGGRFLRRISCSGPPLASPALDGVKGAFSGRESYAFFVENQDRIDRADFPPEEKTALSCANITAASLDLAASLDGAAPHLAEALASLQNWISVTSIRSAAPDSPLGLFSRLAPGGDRYTTNRPRVDSRVATPSHVDPAQVSEVSLGFRFEPGPDVAPHDLDLFLNDWLLDNYRQEIPNGHYFYDADPTTLHYGQGAENTVSFLSYNMNPGQYMTVTDFLLVFLLRDITRTLAASDQAAADLLLCDLAEESYRMSDSAGATASVSLSTGQPVLNVPQTVTLRIFNLGSLGATGSFGLSIENTVVFEGAYYTPGFGRFEVQTEWLPETVGDHEFRLDILPAGPDRNAENNMVTSIVTVLETDEKRLEILLDPGDGGRVAGSGIDCPGQCEAMIENGAIVTLSAQPGDGREFLGWTGDRESADNPLSFVMDDDARILARFGCAELTPPVLPDLVESVYSGDMYTLSWDPVAGATGYILHESPAGDFATFEEFAPVAAYFDRSHDVNEATDYHYRVKALSGCGESDWSETLTVTVLACPDVSAPVLVSPALPIYTDEAYTLTWNEPEGALSYVIQESSSPAFGQPEEAATELPAREYSHSVAGDISFFYRVKSVSFCGESDWSDTLSLTVTARRDYTVTILKEGEGRVTGPNIDCGEDCSEIFTEGTAVSLTAAPANAYRFDSWNVNGVTRVENPLNLQVTGDLDIRAVFVCDDPGAPVFHQTDFNAFWDVPFTVSWPETPFALEYRLEEAASSDFSDAVTHVLTTTSKDFRYAVDEDTDYFYRVRAVTPCTTTAASAPLAVTVRARRRYNISVTLEGQGTVAGGEINCPGRCAAFVLEGTPFSLAATAANGWEFEGWDGDAGGSEPVWNVPSIERHYVVRGLFRLQDPNLSLSPEELAFGEVASGGAGKVLLVELTNNGPGVLHVQSFALEGDESAFFPGAETCLGEAVFANDSCAVAVRFAPESDGEYAGTLKILSNDPESPETAVPLSGVGKTDASLIRIERFTATPDRGEPPLSTILDWTFSGGVSPYACILTVDGVEEVTVDPCEPEGRDVLLLDDLGFFLVGLSVRDAADRTAGTETTVEVVAFADGDQEATDGDMDEETGDADDEREMPPDGDDEADAVRPDGDEDLLDTPEADWNPQVDGDDSENSGGSGGVGGGGCTQTTNTSAFSWLLAGIGLLLFRRFSHGRKRKEKAEKA